MKKATSTAIGFAAAAVPTPAAYFAMLAIVDEGLRHHPMSLLALTGFFYLYALLVSVLLGGVLFVVLRGLELVRWWSALVGGVFIGGATAILSPTHVTLLGDDGFHAMLLALGAGLSGLVFWFVWRRGWREPPYVRQPLRRE